MIARLIPAGGGTVIELDNDVTVIGRRRLCDVRLDHPSISKVHLVVVKTDGVLFFRDLSSTNGTKVNGQRVCRGALLPDDKLTIAALKFTVQLLPGEQLPENLKTEEIDDFSRMRGSKKPPAAEWPIRKVIRPDDVPDDEEEESTTPAQEFDADIKQTHRAESIPLADESDDSSSVDEAYQSF